MHFRAGFYYQAISGYTCPYRWNSVIEGRQPFAGESGGGLDEPCKLTNTKQPSPCYELFARNVPKVLVEPENQPLPGRMPEIGSRKARIGNVSP